MLITRALLGVAEFFFPSAQCCVGCGKPLPSFAFGLCQTCQDRIPCVVSPCCEICGKPLRLGKAMYCLDCHKRTRMFEKHRALGVYEGPLKEMIQALKYRQKREIANPLGHLMGVTARKTALASEIDAIIPVPLHPARERARGYNQAALLARAVGRTIDVPLLPVVHRVKNTDFQSGLSPQQRRDNSRQAFSVTSSRQIRDKRLLLVDDIYTTGSTFEALARLLLRSGAREIYGLSAAIGIRDADWF